jgi:hypothetical protein
MPNGIMWNKRSWQTMEGLEGLDNKDVTIDGSYM